MKLKLIRSAFKSTYIIGHLYVDGVYFCDTIEDRDRGLTQDMPLSQIQKIKVKHQTAIPYGTYKIAMNVISWKYKGKAAFKFTSGRMPRLLNVPGFDGILIHSGTDEDSSSGCIIVGQNKVVGKVINSLSTFRTLWNKLEKAYKNKENITIEIIKKS